MKAIKLWNSEDRRIIRTIQKICKDYLNKPGSCAVYEYLHTQDINIGRGSMKHLKFINLQRNAMVRSAVCGEVQRKF
jgi:hypothetical protein